MAYKKTINVSIILAIMFNIIVLSAAYADWSFTIAKQADGDGDDSYMEDLFLNEGFPTTNYGGNDALIGGYNFNEAALIFGCSTLSDSLDEPAYAGDVDSIKLEIYLQTGAGAGEDFTFNTYAIRAGHIPVLSEATWNIYSTGNSWGTVGCWNTTSDILTTRESDGVHDDSIFVDGEDANETKYTIWLDPSHVSYEYWILHYDYAETGEAVATFYATGGWGKQHHPTWTVYGSEAAETGGGQVIIIQ